ncbi:hypothetical protein ED733_000768 [Metarhizium rileyi]|uniref:Cytochrome P450 n=1 Tax=Metarhizium rileyi (strain RCEF 4871) TaxID=1649241 RepID=A0A5C6FZY9_METRR|nr:hypothetical protein ED733_000768 [Metarhizium rileyi]
MATTVKKPERLKRVVLGAERHHDAKDCPMFLELLNSNLPAQEKSKQRLMYEANGATLAGSGSTAIALSNIVYNLVANPRIGHKLRSELRRKVSDSKNLPTWSTLEELPYLTAVIHEGLRSMYDPSKERLPYDPSQERLPRVATEEELIYEGGSTLGKSKYVIPRGYAISTSAHVVHSDESIFPNASQFDPERWLDRDGQRNKELERHLLSFSKGSRHCLGMQ